MRCPDQGLECTTIELCRKSYFSKYDVFNTEKCLTFQILTKSKPARSDKYQMKLLGIIFRDY